MAYFEDVGLVVVVLFVDVRELVMLEEDVGARMTAVTLVAGAGLAEDEDVGCLAVMGKVVRAGFLKGHVCLAAILFVSVAGCSTEDKDGGSLAGVGVVAGSGWLIGGGCLALLSLVAGDGCYTEDSCLAFEAFGDKYDFLTHLKLLF